MFAALLAAGFAVLAPALVAAESSTVVVRANVTISDGYSASVTRYDEPICSGFVVQVHGTHETIATARHCAENEDAPDGSAITSTPTRVQFFDGDVGHVTSVRKSPTDDVALLDVVSMRVHPSSSPESGVRRGEQLLVFGMPGEIFWAALPAVAIQGNVAPTGRGAASWPQSFAIECPGCMGGLSGSGVWSASGAVTGVLVAGDSLGHVLVVPISRLTTVGA